MVELPANRLERAIVEVFFLMRRIPGIESVMEFVGFRGALLGVNERVVTRGEAINC